MQLNVVHRNGYSIDLNIATKEQSKNEVLFFNVNVDDFTIQQKSTPSVFAQHFNADISFWYLIHRRRLLGMRRTIEAKQFSSHKRESQNLTFERN